MWDPHVNPEINTSIRTIVNICEFGAIQGLRNAFFVIEIWHRTPSLNNDDGLYTCEPLK